MIETSEMSKPRDMRQTMDLRVYMYKNEWQWEIQQKWVYQDNGEEVWVAIPRAYEKSM